MRNWCAALEMSAFLAWPLCAQQKRSGAGGEPTKTPGADEKSAASGSPAESSKPMAAKGTFALPATPRPTPFPGASASSADTRSPAKLVPRYEVAGMYHYINFAPGDPFANSNSHGGSGSLTYNASRWIGLTGEVGGYNTQRNLFPLTGTNNSVRTGLMSYLFSPPLNLRYFDYFVPFSEFLVCGVLGSSQMTGARVQEAFAVSAGGSVAMGLT